MVKVPGLSYELCRITQINIYFKGAFSSMDIKTWNEIQNQIKHPVLNTFFPSGLKLFLNNHFLNMYLN